MDITPRTISVFIVATIIGLSNIVATACADARDNVTLSSPALQSASQLPSFLTLVRAMCANYGASPSHDGLSIFVSPRSKGTVGLKHYCNVPSSGALPFSFTETYTGAWDGITFYEIPSQRGVSIRPRLSGRAMVTLEQFDTRSIVAIPVQTGGIYFLLTDDNKTGHVKRIENFIEQLNRASHKELVSLSFPSFAGSTTVRLADGRGDVQIKISVGQEGLQTVVGVSARDKLDQPRVNLRAKILDFDRELTFLIVDSKKKSILIRGSVDTH